VGDTLLQQQRKQQYLSVVNVNDNVNEVFAHCARKKNTHSRFLLYLGGKYFDVYKISRVRL